MPLQVLQLAELAGTGEVARREQTLFNGGAAYYRVYRTRDDRNVVLGSVEPKFWRAFCDAADRPDWAARQGEPLPQTDLIAELNGFFAGMSLEECCRRFESADCYFAPVLDLQEAVDSDHARARDLVRRRPDGSIEALFPVWVDNEPPRSRAPLQDDD